MGVPAKTQPNQIPGWGKIAGLNHVVIIITSLNLKRYHSKRIEQTINMGTANYERKGQMTIKMVYMTAGNMDEASRIAKALVQRRLAACVNIIDGMRSVYEWEGTLEEAREVVMIAKTHAHCLPELEEAVKGMHSYDCPCIVGVDVSDGNNEFLDWVRAQVNPGSIIKDD